MLLAFQEDHSTPFQKIFWADNSWFLHTALVLRDHFAKNSTHIVPQPPYSPDLAPCDTNCRVCRNKEETLQHVIECEEIMNKLKAPEKEWWKGWREKRKTKDLRKELLADLQKEMNEEICSKLGKIAKILNVKD